MRLIDADALKTIRSIQSADYNSIETIQHWIDNAPTIDAVPVIRCKECKYWGKIGTVCRKLDNVMFWYGTDSTDYCSFAKRKDDE